MPRGHRLQPLRWEGTTRSRSGGRGCSFANIGHAAVGLGAQTSCGLEALGALGARPLLSPTQGTRRAGWKGPWGRSPQLVPTVVAPSLQAAPACLVRTWSF